MTHPTPRPKSPLKAGLLCAFLGPGAGQWYNGQRFKAVLLGLAGLLLMGGLIFVVVSAFKQQLDAGINAADMTDLHHLQISLPPEYTWISWGLIALWVGGIFEAVMTAKRLNAEAIASLLPPTTSPNPPQKPLE